MHTSQPRMVLANGVELCVQTFGDPDSPAILLIGGAAGSMDWWEDEFCERVASGPRFVIRYDLRDTGQSVSYEAGAPLHDGSDLVEDAVGLLDAFRIARAHVCYSRAARPGRGECRHLPHSLSRCRPRRRGGRERALRVVLFAAAFGAVASPNLLGPSGDLAEALGLNRLAGLYLVAVAAFAAAGLLLAALPRRALPVSADRTVSRRELRAGLRSVRLALIVLAASNLVMVAVMAIAPVHLAEHGHSLDFVGVVVSVQVLCMFAPSPLTGWLADRAGSATVAALGEAFSSPRVRAVPCWIRRTAGR